MVRSPYPSDLTHAEWSLVEPLIPVRKSGRQAKIPMREILNAILFILRTGSQWRYLPHDFPPWQNVYDYFRRLTHKGIWERINHALLEKVRLSVGKKVQPTAAIIDSQSVKTTETGSGKGFDGGKKIKGIKRHIAVDTLGLLLTAMVTSAGVQDRDGARPLIEAVYDKFPMIELIWADGGYAGKLVAWAKDFCAIALTIVKRGTEKGFKILPRRWVVERTFGWLGRNRRLSKDYEREPAAAQSFVYLASVRLMVRRLSTL